MKLSDGSQTLIIISASLIIRLLSRSRRTTQTVSPCRSFPNKRFNSLRSFLPRLLFH
ncbi:Uncharacterised protein [Legionella beliardensis]|uniref:Uncharacterized protein n=1 Tax=Legionella beliardensis TaxID=91822 RepID=A0A378I4Q7_9GAMM|nr:Uncharacterised protein [Legionella beliardensis]